MFTQLRVLCESPERWTKIYAVSRSRPHTQWPGQIEHITMDLLQPPETIAAQLIKRGIVADYVFFFAYIQPEPAEGKGIWDAADEMVATNSLLLRNFLDGLSASKIIPRRIHLQLGAKYYGIHLGPTSVPQEETDPQVVIEPNFYYAQEAILRQFCQKHGTGWNTTRPSYILGAVPNAAMNLLHPLAIYVIVQKHLGRALEFPSDLAAWEANVAMSSAQMNSYLSEWAVLTDSAKNESFNAADDCPFTWGKFWPRLAEEFDMPYTRPMPERDPSPYASIELPHDPPPRGFGPRGKLRCTFTLTQWAKTSEVQQAWEEIATRHQLRDTELRDVDRIFGFLDMALTGSWSVNFRCGQPRFPFLHASSGTPADTYHHCIV